MPVGMCVRRTAESVVLTDWPPGPEDLKTSTRISLSGISMESVCSISGMTSTAPNEGLTLVAPFLPSPLIEKLSGEGFFSRVEHQPDGGWVVHFWRDET